MVVTYPSSSRGSATSFFTVTPRLIFWLHGSAIPNVLPQCLLAQAAAFVAWQSGDLIVETFDVGKIEIGVVGFLVAFLLIFKTQTSYKQFWTAFSQVDGMLQINRILARGACTLFDWKTVEARGYVRRFLRYQVLYFFVLIEHFIREKNGKPEHEPPEGLDLLRRDIEAFCREDEFQRLYPGTEMGTPGSVAEQRAANPVIVLYWMQLILRKGYSKQFIAPPPVLSIMVNGVSGLERHFWTMEKIDKLQFPLPYAQVVKILVITYVFAFPFVIAADCRMLTMPITLLVSLGFFGLDEVAEILESPFSSDPNAINLRDFVEDLIRDLDVMFYHHEDMTKVAVEAGFDDEKSSLTERFRQSHTNMQGSKLDNYVQPKTTLSPRKTAEALSEIVPTGPRPPSDNMPPSIPGGVGDDDGVDGMGGMDGTTGANGGGFGGDGEDDDDDGM